MDGGQARKIYCFNSLEPRNDLEEKMCSCFAKLQEQVANLSERDAHDKLVALAQSQYEDVCLGLLHGVLTVPHLAPKFFRDVNFINRDGLKAVTQAISIIIHENYSKLQDISREQVFWFVQHSVRSDIGGMDSALQFLMRQIVGGDISNKNIWLANNIIDLLLESRAWLEKNSHVIGHSVYTFLRLMCDHFPSQFSLLLQKEINFCCTMLRERFVDCLVIGRDLVRLLVQVAKIPEIEAIWSLMLFSPSSLSPNFEGIEQLLSQRTARRFIINRLTPEMEKRIYFALNEVKLSNVTRYQNWFIKQYLSTPESQTLRADLIRYICCVVHPPNEILASEITPRWALILWLIQTCSALATVSSSFAKLALFFDFLCYNVDCDSIMNIEPGILVMFNAVMRLPQCVSIAGALLDFLVRVTNEFGPNASLKSKTKESVFVSLRQIIEKRVLVNFVPLFECPKLDRELRAQVRALFSEFCSVQPIIEVKPEEPSIAASQLPEVIEIPDESNDMESEADSGAQFSDDGDEDVEELDEDVSKLSIDVSTTNGTRRSPSFPTVAKPDISGALERLSDNLKKFIVELQTVSDNNDACDVIQRLLLEIFREEDLDEEQAPFLADCLCGLLYDQFSQVILPEVLTTENIDDSVARPLYVIIRSLCLQPDEDRARQPLLLLLAEMYEKQPRIGYHVLYFLKVSDTCSERMSPYKDLCKMVNISIDVALHRDLSLCESDDHRLFFYLLSEVYTKLPSASIPNSALMNLIVSTITPLELHTLVCEIVQDKVIMIKRESIASIITKSLGCETIEQYFLWQLVFAHDVKVEWVLNIIPKLQYPMHCEALMNILLLIQRSDIAPTVAIVRSLLFRPIDNKDDLFSASVLKLLYDTGDEGERLAEQIGGILTRSLSADAQHAKTNKKQTKEPSPEQILGHLDIFRQHGKQFQAFVEKDAIQNALHEAQKACSDSLKRKYSELFAVMELLDSVNMKSSRSLRRSRKHAVGASGADSSEDEGKSRHPVKKKKKTTVESDSD